MPTTAPTPRSPEFAEVFERTVAELVEPEASGELRYSAVLDAMATQLNTWMESPHPGLNKAHGDLFALIRCAQVAAATLETMVRERDAWESGEI